MTTNSLPERKPLEFFEPAARQLCTMNGKSPDEMAFYGQGEKKRPLWIQYAETLRNHYERDQLLDWLEAEA